MSSPVSTSYQRIISEALLSGLARDSEPARDLCPGAAVLPGADDGRGEVTLRLADGGVGVGDPVQDVELRAGSQAHRGEALADGGSGLGARPGAKLRGKLKAPVPPRCTGEGKAGVA